MEAGQFLKNLVFALALRYFGADIETINSMLIMLKMGDVFWSMVTIVLRDQSK